MSEERDSYKAGAALERHEGAAAQSTPGAAPMLRLLTAFEEERIEELLAHERSCSKGTELLICISEDGLTEIDRVEGMRNRADLSPTMWNHLAVGGQCRLWHNHPSGNSLSEGDWRLAVENPGIVEVSVVTATGARFRGSVLNRERLKDILQVEPKGGSRFGEAHTAAAIAILCVADPFIGNALSEAAGHLVNKHLTAAGLIEYRTQLNADEIAQFCAVRAAEAIEEAQRSIRSWLELAP